MKLLQEEAQMLEPDAIIRYIRIFSELSGQIKYASQKRVLTEIALIKLCRPQMEAKKDSLLDRIRAVEEKVEKGVVVAAVPQGMPVGGTAQAAAPVVKKELPKAIPEDVEQVVSNWQSIVGRAEQPMKLYLQNAKLSLGGDNRLMVVLPDGIMSDYFTQNQEHQEQLMHIISGFLGKQIEVEFQVLRDDMRFEENYVDLSSLINMEIEEEEDEEESEEF